jgi:hypothetical protein
MCSASSVLILGVAVFHAGPDRIGPALLMRPWPCLGSELDLTQARQQQSPRNTGKFESLQRPLDYKYPIKHCIGPLNDQCCQWPP